MNKKHRHEGTNERITYTQVNESKVAKGRTTRWNARLDGKIVGQIRRELDGWKYFPKGQKIGGEAFKDLSACQASLETDIG